MNSCYGWVHIKFFLHHLLARCLWCYGLVFVYLYGLGKMRWQGSYERHDGLYTT